MKEWEFKDDINIQLLLKLFKAFPNFFENIISFIDIGKQINQKSKEEKHYFQKIKENFNSLNKNINDLNNLFKKLKEAKINNAPKEEDYECNYEKSYDSKHYKHFYDLNSKDNSTDNISESKDYTTSKNIFMSIFMHCIKKIFEEFNYLLNNEKENHYPYKNKDSLKEWDSIFNFLEEISLSKVFSQEK